jgi:hypothetical protein
MVPIFVLISLLFAALCGLILGTVWWLGLWGAATIGGRNAGTFRIVAVIAVGASAAIGGAISASIAPLLYSSRPVNSAMFDFVSAAILAGGMTFVLLLKTELFRPDWDANSEPPAPNLA